MHDHPDILVFRTVQPRDSFPTKKTSLLTLCTHLYVLTSLDFVELQKSWPFCFLNVIFSASSKLFQLLNRNTFQLSNHRSDYTIPNTTLQL
ncbi:hypothetical protein E4T50_01434 [Aureobasidium sp. EXF-12298]|nr:hypothetical protein E4T50_01434 [Aureobasidium sp. EXF-12298]